MRLELNLNTLLGVLVATALVATAKLLWSTSVMLAEINVRVEGHEKRITQVEEKVL